MNAHIRRLGVALLAALMVMGCEKDKKHVFNPPADTDGDGIYDSNDNCPSIAGEAQYGGCPWYRVDACSGDAPYTLGPYRWSTTAMYYYYGTSLPSNWRPAADAAVYRWNNAGAHVSVRLGSVSPVSAGAARDGKSVVSYGPLADEYLGMTYIWASNGVITDADVVINSRQPFMLGESSTTYDLLSVLVHEFGHFVGLNHVNDRTHTMYPGTPLDCTIYRTLCAGDIAGVRRLFP